MDNKRDVQFWADLVAPNLIRFVLMVFFLEAAAEFTYKMLPPELHVTITKKAIIDGLFALWYIKIVFTSVTPRDMESFGEKFGSLSTVTKIIIVALLKALALFSVLGVYYYLYPIMQFIRG